MPASVGTVWVDVRFNVGDAGRQLQASLAGATAGAAGASGAAAAIERSWTTSLGNISASLAKTGQQMSTFVTLPLALLGKSAVSTFKEFDKAMTQISALNAVPIEQTERWREEVRGLGLEYGVAAEEAAKGLYFITSSGVAAADAMGVLQVATKASAVGLGEVKVVADVITSAMSAYGKENISAAKAGDILAASVRFGKGEADELAGALSQVIPLAANAKVSFGEMAGAMAAMTLSGTSADQAATQLRGLFNTLQDMPPVAQKALLQYTGLNAETLKLKLSSEGLIPTLKLIFDRFGDNKNAMAEVFGNIRALTGIMNLFGNNTERTMQIIRDVTNASGDLNRAWEITAQSKAKKLELAMNRIHDAMLGVGSDLAPTITSVANVVGGLAQAFNALPGPVRSSAVAFGTLAAAAGPAFLVLGKMGQGLTGLAGAVTNASPALRRFSDGLRLQAMYANESSIASGGMVSKLGGLNQVLGATGIALAAGVAAWALWQRSMNEAREAMADWKTGVVGAGGGIKGADDQVASLTARIKGLEDESSASNLSRWNPLDLDYFQQLGEGVNTARDALKVIEKNKALAGELATATGRSKDALYDWLAAEALVGHTYESMDPALKALIEGTVKGTDAGKAFAGAVQSEINPMGNLINRAQDAADAFFALTQAEDKVADAQQAIADANQKVTDAQDAYHDAQLKTLEASRKITDAERKHADAVNDVTTARRKLADAQNELNAALRGPSEGEQLDVESARIRVQEAQKALRGKFTDPLDRRKAQIDLRRAQLELEQTEGAHAERVAGLQDKVRDAQSGVNSALQAELDARQSIVDARNAKAEASANEAKAFEAIGIAQQGVWDAEKDLVDATWDLAQKQSALNDALALGQINGSAFLSMLDELKNKYPEIAGVIDQYSTKYRELWAAAGNKEPGQTPPPPPPAPAPQLNDPTLQLGGGAWMFRAAGGPLSKGQLAQVNERGTPELWSAGGKQFLLPVDNGQVTPLKPMENVPVAGGDTSNVEMNVYVSGDPVQNAYEVRRQLRSYTGGRR